jgi:hypothetical protein
LNEKVLSLEIASFEDKEMSSDKAVLDSASEVDPKVTSEELGDLVGAVLAAAVLVLAAAALVAEVPDWSIVWRERAVESEESFCKTLSSYFYWLFHHSISVSESAVSLVRWFSGLSARFLFLLP